MSAAKPSAQMVELLFGANGKKLQGFDCTWCETCHSINQIPSAKLKLNFNEANLASGQKSISVQNDDLKLCQPGKEVKLRVMSKSEVFSGIVTQQECSLKDNCLELTLTLRHSLQRLVSTHRSQVFADKTDAEIVKTIFKEHEVACKKCEGLDVKHPQMLQFACSDWRFVRSRLAANNVWLLASPTEVQVIKPSLAGKAQHSLLRVRSDAKHVSVDEAYWRRSCTELPEALSVSNWSVSEQKMSAALSGMKPKLGSEGLDPSQFKPLSKQKWQLAYTTALASGEAQALAHGRLLAQHTAGVQANFTVSGSADYEIGQTLELAGFSTPLNGLGLISEVRHRFTAEGWDTLLALGQDLMRDVAADLLPTAQGLYIGIVAKHKADPDNATRLQVSLPALNLDNKPIWARFAAPYASKDSGLCLYPEEGDEVVLGFLEEDPRYPVILGALHNPKNKPPFPPSVENLEKGLVLAKGDQKQQLVFNTKDGSAVLEAGKDQLTLKQGITLASNEAVTITAQKKIEVAAKQQVNVQGQSGVTVKGAKVDLSN